MVRGHAPIGQSQHIDRKSTRLNSSHGYISYAVFCLKKKIQPAPGTVRGLSLPLPPKSIGFLPRGSPSVPLPSAPPLAICHPTYLGGRLYTPPSPRA